jgi:hypothetical protein
MSYLASLHQFLFIMTIKVMQGLLTVLLTQPLNRGIEGKPVIIE